MIYLEPAELVTLTGYKCQIEDIAATRRPWDDPADNYGIYFLFFGDALQYVGQSMDITTRLEQHRYPDRPSLRQADWFDTVATIGIEEDAFVSPVECYYIHKLKPPRNVSYPPIRRFARILLDA